MFKNCFKSTKAIPALALFGLFGGSSNQSTETTAPATTTLPVSIEPSKNNNLPAVNDVPVNPSEFFKYGFPGPIHDLRNSQEFITCYDRQKRNPYWVLEHITKESIKSNGKVDRKYSAFKEDTAIPLKFRALLKDYFRSGYDRGHQAPAADAKFNQQAMNETFALTNIAPQIGDGFNRDYWSHFEFFVRDLTKKYDSVRVMTGPLYLPKKFPDGKFRVVYEVIGNPPNIAVPTHFFKLIVGETKQNPKLLNVAAFVLPNDVISNETPLREFQVPVEMLESSTGLDLLQRVDKNYTVKNLCHDVECRITVRDFSNNVKQITSGK